MLRESGMSSKYFVSLVEQDVRPCLFMWMYSPDKIIRTVGIGFMR
jgi:hypothetical protein